MLWPQLSITTSHLASSSTTHTTLSRATTIESLVTKDPTKFQSSRKNTTHPPKIQRAIQIQSVKRLERIAVFGKDTTVGRPRVVGDSDFVLNGAMYAGVFSFLFVEVKPVVSEDTGKTSLKLVQTLDFDGGQSVWSLVQASKGYMARQYNDKINIVSSSKGTNTMSIQSMTSTSQLMFECGVLSLG